ncbi:MAG: 5'/3'-nucleotidase SurE [Isosphaeraceae bacterium]|nr:5'/3'-nucleotidase SurE [Isosphaeraceae bacterium]
MGHLFLLTNDDGLGAPGLDALEAATDGLGPSCMIAPSGPLSGCSHKVTTDVPVRVRRDERGRTAVEGTPADCVRLALHHLAPATSWVLSGINAGGNLGTDIHHSGTVAAVREAVIHGRPGIALSQYLVRGQPVDWQRTAGWARRALAELLARPIEPGSFWNVNFPHPAPGGPEPEVIDCPLDPSPLPLVYHVEGDVARYAGNYHQRARQPGSDVDVCFRGQIAVSLVRLIPPAERG